MTSKVIVAAFLCLCVQLTHGHASSSGVLDLDTFKLNMLHHFETFGDVRHPRDSAKASWMNSRDYVHSVFKAMGLQIEYQCFNTSVYLEFENEKEVEGCNIIGTSQGALDRNTIVIGADYDSSGSAANFDPLRNNGAGISLLLEVARGYENSWRWKGWHKNFTTIFVAFDLNTKDQFPESNGHSGSFLFVNDWLLPKLQKSRQPLAGSFILDSIATYNTEPNSQVVLADTASVFPDAHARIVEDKKTGNFIAAIGPKGESERFIKDFSGHYRMDRMRRPYRLQEMIGEDFGSGPTIQSLNGQAAYHFWTAKPSLPSVLITDTGSQRVYPPAEQCTQGVNDCNYIFANKERMDFLYSTYKALVYTVLDKQATFVGLTSGASNSFTSFASILSIVTSFAVVRMLMKL